MVTIQAINWQRNSAEPHAELGQSIGLGAKIEVALWINHTLPENMVLFILAGGIMVWMVPLDPFRWNGD